MRLVPDDDPGLAEEIEQFSKERQKIDTFLKAVNKTKLGPFGRLADIGFILALVLLVAARFVFNWVDNILSLELGVLLVSLKIIWLMKIQNNYNHFMFMLMHASESRQNLMLQRLDELATKLGAAAKVLKKPAKAPEVKEEKSS